MPIYWHFSGLVHDGCRWLAVTGALLNVHFSMANIGLQFVNLFSVAAPTARHGVNQMLVQTSLLQRPARTPFKFATDYYYVAAR
jgi:hypothetical protein